MVNSYNEYLKGLEQYPPLSSEEEQRIGQTLSSAATPDEKQAARQRLINHNLRWVVKVANEYKRKSSWKQADLMDIIAAGNMGLVTAADKYDWRMGGFLSYADSWIHLFIKRLHLNTGNTIRVPINIIDMVCYISGLQGYLEQVLGRTPSTAEIVEAMDGMIGQRKVEDLLSHRMAKAVSIDSSPSGDEDGDMTYAEIIESGCESPEESALKKERSALLRQALGELPYVNRRVIELQFGLTDEGEKTLDEISLMLHNEGYDNGGKPYTKQNISLIRIKGIEMIQQNQNIMNQLKYL